MENRDLNQLLETIWNHYTALNPRMADVRNLMATRDEVTVNDHVAFRTIHHPRVALETMMKPFIDLGYQEKGQYRFEDKKLNARHFEHATDPKAPKIFISELMIHECSPLVQKTFLNSLEGVPDGLLGQPEFLVSGRHWPIDLATYEGLAEESEYAAWMYIYGFRVNHFTLKVNHLTSFAGIADVNEFVEGHGFPLNEFGGRVKGTPASLLEQSSTIADPVTITFGDGQTKDIPSVFYEFAKRYPTANGQEFSGFIANHADLIFQSTDRQHG